MRIVEWMQDAEMHLLNKARNVKNYLQSPENRFINAGKFELEHGEREVHELPELVEPGSNVIDVGANVGSYAYILSNLVGSEGHVYCVEPLKDLAEVIRKAAERSELPISVLNCGLSSRKGFTEIFVPYEKGRRIHACASFKPIERFREKHKVELRRLDDITENFDKKISFIKIDVEGHELEVLKGGVKTLERHRPNLQVEIEERHSNDPVSLTFDFLSSQNYKGYYLGPDYQRIPLEHFDLQKNQISQEVGSPEYINNFMFIPAEQAGDPV